MGFPISSTARLLRCRHALHIRPPAPQSRSIFSLIRRLKGSPKPTEQVPILTEDNLFHPLSKSPFPAVVARGEAIKTLAPCPVCASSHGHIHAHTKAQPKAVKFECPDCGWPTHCTKEHWKEDIEHQKYCPRLREANEDEHDLRSGRRMREFEMPGMCYRPHACGFGVEAFLAQVLRATKKQYPSPTGMSSGTHVALRRWTQNALADTQVSS